MFEINDIVTKDNYTEAAIFCNKAGDRHIELVEGKYMIVANPPAPEPTLEEQVAKMEAETGLTRVMREIVLSENSGASEYVKSKAQEIEDLASQLRTNEETSVTEAVGSKTEKVDETELKEYNSFSDTEK